MEPYTNYSKLLRELQDNVGVFAEGSVAGVQRDQEVAQALQLSESGNCGPSNAQWELLWKTVLIYQIVLLESMVGDYACFFLDRTGPCNKETSPDSELGFYSETEPLDRYDIDKWKSKLKRWVSYATTQRGREHADSTRLEFVKNQLVRVCTPDDYWWRLCKATVVRNVLVHNQGIMNDRNWKAAKLCDVDNSVVWDKKLVYDTMNGLYLLNSALGGTCIPM